jgi:hypothetical protein
MAKIGRPTKTKSREQRIQALRKYYTTVRQTISVHRLRLGSACPKVDALLNEIGMSR